MKVYYSPQEYKAGKRAVATVGVFDGVHTGHKQILARLIQLASERNGESVVITFHPHPRKVLYPEDNDLQLLQTLDEKIERLAFLGISKVLVVPFTLSFSRLTAEQFVDQIVLQTINAEKVCIGYDHRFGRNRTGGFKEMERIAQNHSFEVEEIPAYQIDAANVSSTKIRNALLEGNIELANRYLEYEYPLTGTVVEGDRLGNTIGFPTANLKPIDENKLVPGNGVYAVRVKVDDHIYSGMMNIGVRPTVNGQDRRLEVHILNFNENLYGKNISLSFVRKIREEKKFNSLQHLQEQLTNDRSVVKSILE